MFLRPFYIIMVFTFSSVFSAQAANYGQFKLKPKDNLPVHSDPVVFQLDSSGEIEITENKSYFEIIQNYFFGDIISGQTLEFIGGGDEQALHALYSLSDNKIIYGCAAYIDYQGNYAETLTIKNFKNFELLRWNTDSENYELMITEKTEFDSEACYAELFKNFDGIEIF